MKKLLWLFLCLALCAFVFAEWNTKIVSKDVVVPEWSTIASICPVFKWTPVKNSRIIYAKVNGIGGRWNTMIAPSGVKKNYAKKGLDGVKSSDRIVAGGCREIPLGTPTIFASDTYNTWKVYVYKTLPQKGTLVYYISKPQSLVNVNVSFK